MKVTMEVEREHCDFCWPGIWERADVAARVRVQAEHPRFYEDVPADRLWLAVGQEERRKRAIGKALSDELAKIEKTACVVLHITDEGDDYDWATSRWVHVCRRHLEEALRMLEDQP